MSSVHLTKFDQIWGVGLQPVLSFACEDEHRPSRYTLQQEYALDLQGSRHLKLSEGRRDVMNNYIKESSLWKSVAYTPQVYAEKEGKLKSVDFVN